MPVSRNSWISAGGCIALALGVLILPLRWLIASIFAAAIHEFCHWVAIRLCGGKVTDFVLGRGGAVISAEQLSRGKELLCALAGPIGGLLLLLAARWLPAVAICAAMQSVYNLLPIYPLDGGRALKCGTSLLLPPNAARKVCSWVQRSCLVLITAGAVYASAWLKLGLMPVLLALAVIAKGNSGKIPCKQWQQRVQ